MYICAGDQKSYFTIRYERKTIRQHDIPGKRQGNCYLQSRIPQKHPEALADSKIHLECLIIVKYY